MRSIIAALSLLFIQTVAFGQTIEGNRLLDLVDKPVSDPLFRQLKAQENFYTDAWDEDFTIYISRDNGVITEVELQNGKLRYGSKTERYGYYARTLPLQVNWNMRPADFSSKFGEPVIVSTNMGFKDYKSNGWYIRVFFEQEKPVSISYKKIAGSSPVTAPVKSPATPSKPVTNFSGSDWLINLKSSDQAEFNWNAFQVLVNNFNNMQIFAGKDSVDYIGQVYYNSNLKMPGFERTAVKRKKSGNRWHFEAFLKVAADSNKARNIFFALYDAIKAGVNGSGAKDDFILASVARDPVSKSPVNWMAQWSLYTNYKQFVPGLGKLRFILMLSGMKNAFKNDQMEYTIKIYMCDPSVEVDFFTWDTPRG